MQGEFAEFKQDIVSGPLDQALSPLAYKWIGELTECFADESLREAKFRELLSELLDGSKKKFSNITDGGIDLSVTPLLVKVRKELTQRKSDAFFEVVSCYFEGSRRILADDAFGEWRKTRLPSLLIIHNGTS